MAIETYTIYPTRKYSPRSLPSTIALHGLDLSDPIQIHNHRFFHCPARTTSEVINNLKDSLAEALELYPPVSGTVQANERGELYIAMDAKHTLGTPFLVEMKDTPFAGDSEDLSPRTVPVLPPASSTLAMKVTQFSCGTIAVAASINHQVTDLRGFLDFLELWALVARGDTIDFTRIPEDWSRTPGRFFTGLINDPTASSRTPPPFTVLPSPTTGLPPSLLVPSDVSRWIFTKSSMERLKRDFSPSATSEEHESDQWISSGDALAALICGVITRAREDANVARLQGRSSLDLKTEKIAMAADGRDRSPQGQMAGGRYFGNFNTLWSTSVSRSDLLSLSCKSASRVALAIRGGINLELSPEAIASKILFFEAPQNIRPPGRITWSADVILTNWCRFDLQGPKLDFGWGKPFRSTAGGGDTYPPGYCIMMRENDSGDVIIIITVELEGADALKADLMLNKYATLVHFC